MDFRCRRLAVHDFIYEYPVLKLVSGCLWDDYAVLTLYRDDDGTATSVAEKMLSVREYGSYADSSCGLADGSADRVDLSLVSVKRSVAQKEIDCRHLLHRIVERLILLDHVEHLVLCH